jgi:hypothetical protein
MVINISQNSCTMCYRYDMSKSQEYYWSDHIVRSLKEIKECAKKQEYSCEHMPLVNIPLENVILDELHLMLRITGTKTYHQAVCTFIYLLYF